MDTKHLAATVGCATQQPRHRVHDDATIFRRVLVGADHAAGQGVDDDEAVAAPINQGH
jgi:hypothetical protein